MNPYANEEVMWQRLKDLQREAEYSRQVAEHTLPGLVRSVTAWAIRGRRLRRSELRVIHADDDTTTRVA